MKKLLLVLLTVALCGCTGSAPKKEPQGPEANQLWGEPLRSVALMLPPSEPEPHALLDIGLVIFDPGVPEDPVNNSKLGIFPEIRKAESRYQPYILRENLVKTQAWGAVRVLPRPDASAELQLSGKILHSDGSHLVLQVRAVDSTGQVWFDKVYHDEAVESDYPVIPGNDPYADMYRQISNDILSYSQQLSPAQFKQIREIALLQYAASLSPEAFDGFVSADAEGLLVVNRLPSQDDPMLERVQRIKNQEFLFIDNADEQYLELYDRMTPTYNLWRQNGRELAIYKVEYEARESSRDRDGRRGTYAAMQQTYNAYKRSKEHDQDLDELAQGFNNEVAPTVLEVQGKVFRLNGSLDSQYTEWRSILRSIFALETGLPPAAE
ncbi:MAG: hypothetical protein V7709_18580 [Halioglobus sp.]